MIQQLLFPGLLNDCAGRLAQHWRRLRVWLGDCPFMLAETAIEGQRREDTETCQHCSEAGSRTYGDAARAGPLGRSTNGHSGEVDRAAGSRSIAGDGGGYCFVSVPDSEGVSLFSATTADGSRAVILFDDQLTAEAFVHIEQLGYSWEIVEYAPCQTAVLLEACLLTDVGYVALNPPSQAVTARWDLRLTPIASFVGSLLGEEEGA